MLFNHNNDIDDDLELSSEKKTTKKKKEEKLDISLFKGPLIILGVLVFVIIIIFLCSKLLSGNEFAYDEKLYFINLEGDNNITLYLGEEYIEPGYSGRDDSDNDLTSDIVVDNNVDINNIGNYHVTYTLGNVTKERNIKVIEKPTGATHIHLYGDVNVFLYVGEEYQEKGYEVVDTVDGSNLKDKVTINSNVDTSKEGIYKIIYSVTNSSGVTTSVQRSVVVMDRTLSLLIDNNEVTNKNVIINIYVKDEMFDYLLLPNNIKTKEKISTYEVSSNGTYKFVMYNTKGESKEKSITIRNIDKESPMGSCSGYYKSGISQIEVKASDDSGISKYVIDNKTYTSNNIKLDKEIATAAITIFDKAGNSKAISCNLTNKNPKTTTTTTSKTTVTTTTITTTKKTTKYVGTVNKLMNKDLCDKVYDITAEDLDKLFEKWAKKTGNYDSPIRGTGDAWIKACDETGLDPLTLLGISGHETGRGGFRAMPWMKQKNFFGMRYIDPTGDGTGRSVKWAGENDVFDGDVYKAVLQSAKRIKNFYYGQHGGHTMLGLAKTGYAGTTEPSRVEAYAYSCSSIMLESLEYIQSLH